jgi:hypothetical protein
LSPISPTASAPDYHLCRPTDSLSDRPDGASRHSAGHPTQSLSIFPEFIIRKNGFSPFAHLPQYAVLICNILTSRQFAAFYILGMDDA